ncbi:unannotated protein [freshwater metagenome]|uniref:Unannotated protein n=1 Tax=freshwater metagenome TaxID=449393 RepID=A0A6J6CCH2_9ZZZZ
MLTTLVPVARTPSEKDCTRFSDVGRMSNPTTISSAATKLAKAIPISRQNSSVISLPTNPRTSYDLIIVASDCAVYATLFILKEGRVNVHVGQ